MSKGIIFNIQKFSIHDGPGIRTTVFLKGCPLKCKWCANPESQMEKVQILYDSTKCIHCLSCVNSCPSQAIQHKDDKIIIDHEKCTGCLTCANICPQKALENEGEYKEIKSVVDVCIQDIPFYEESGGGITISGGEGMSQPQFLKELICELKKHKLHVAIETTGYIKSEIFQKLASMLDLLLFDVKHYDSNQHYLGTNVHNKLIIENLKWAIKNNIEVLPRIPVIPDFNSSLDDAKGLSKLLIDVGAKRVQLLPFHQFGEKKYDLLNRQYSLKNKKALHPEDLKDYQKIFLDKGLDCFF
ncbi:glycyl-radical enzyme activating protein [Clostridium sp.]|uniref:glycyl-radical enzyme activating protein n=1 Tax=Clostridium sp. TaxID=1506 RepID=UPI00291252D5|nr:glycyl-radical enzyme activating protein [Clostridium sp.]MDU4588879.1 glycyl-radical enzyme activating protein [Clostridium sp.]